jgi:UDP-glucose 4-epimerase
MRILVTGGAGYVGTALCHSLLQLKEVESVTVYDNLSRHNYNLFIGIKKFDARYQFIEGDILDSRNLRKAVSKADVVFHLAAKVTTPFADQDAHLFEQVNHWGNSRSDLRSRRKQCEASDLLELGFGIRFWRYG